MRDGYRTGPSSKQGNFPPMEAVLALWHPISHGIDHGHSSTRCDYKINVDHFLIRGLTKCDTIRAFMRITVQHHLWSWPFFSSGSSAHINNTADAISNLVMTI